MSKQRKSVVERYKKAYRLFKANKNMGWHEALRQNGINNYPKIELDKYKSNRKLDLLISDFIGMVNRCRKKYPEFLEYCMHTVHINELRPDNGFSHMANTVNEVSRQIKIDFMSDAEVIEQVRKRGLYIGADGKYHKKEIIEKVIDIE